MLRELGVLVLAGVMTLLSYRDPNFCDTLSIYVQVAAFLRTADFPAVDIETAIIGTIGDLDQPQSADSAVCTECLNRFRLHVRKLAVCR